MVLFTPVSGPHQAFLLVSLMPQYTIGTETLIDRVRTRIASEMPGLKVSFQSGGIISDVLNAGLPAPIDLKLLGQDLNDLKTPLCTSAMRSLLCPVLAT